MQIHKWASSLLESAGRDQQFLVTPKDFHIWIFKRLRFELVFLLLSWLFLFRQNERGKKEKS